MVNACMLQTVCRKRETLRKIQHVKMDEKNQNVSNSILCVYKQSLSASFVYQLCNVCNMDNTRGFSRRFLSNDLDLV